ncbi:MAG: SRPBCC domain-containing protein [Longispora sp.]|nr:SRPBCC domain-containing protein [Longispora sp. (in: high G+C Gram-positive bacteria)]
MSRIVRTILAAVTASIVLAVPNSAPASATSSKATIVPSPEQFNNRVVYRHEVVIAADRTRIWQLLTDFPAYKDWNPFVIQAEGKAIPGATVNVKAVFHGLALKFKQKVTTVAPEEEFCWEDAGWNSKFASAHRCRTLIPMSDGTVLFTQEVVIDGGLIKVADLFMGHPLREGVEAETTALKWHAEH